MKNMAFGKLAHCIVSVNNAQTPGDEEWDAYLDFLRKHLGPGKAHRGLVMSDGGVPTAAQRQKLVLVTGLYAAHARVAVATNSAMVRGVVTALSWFQPVYRAFPMTRLGDACEYLGLPRAAEGELRKLIAALQDQVRSLGPAGGVR
jgi:hypothetical protein